MLKEYYNQSKSKLQKQLKLKNAMQTPAIEKVVLNMCIGEAVKNPKILNKALEDLSQIAGQKVVVRKAKKDAAQFKIRKGLALGGSVTLRNKKMWSFLERLIHFALPRVRDFKGLSEKSFDGNGNYNLGVKEQIIFPEVDYDKVDAIRGFHITICTNVKDNLSAHALLKHLGFPFRK